jgi:hypothetical protein
VRNAKSAAGADLGNGSGRPLRKRRNAPAANGLVSLSGAGGPWVHNSPDGRYVHSDSRRTSRAPSSWRPRILNMLLISGWGGGASSPMTRQCSGIVRPSGIRSYRCAILRRDCTFARLARRRSLRVEGTGCTSACDRSVSYGSGTRLDGAMVQNRYSHAWSHRLSGRSRGHDERTGCKVSSSCV